MTGPPDQFDLAARFAGDASARRLTGAIYINSTQAIIYFSAGAPCHAVLRDALGAVRAGEPALRSILTGTLARARKVEWQDLEAVPAGTFDLGADALIDAIKRMGPVPSNGQPVAPTVPPAAGPPAAVAVPWTTRDFVAGLVAFPVLAVSRVVLSPLFRAAGLSGGALEFALDTAIYGTMVALVVWTVAGLHHATWRDLGFRLPALEWLAYCLPITGVALVVGGTLETFAAHFFTGTVAACTAYRTTYGSGPALALGVIGTVVTGPAVEETLFRGFAFGWLRPRTGLAMATLASAAVFAIPHYWFDGAPSIPATAFLGVVLAVMRERSGSIVPGAVVHALFNLYGLIAYLSVATCH